jgi:acyl-CoA thioesterase-1
MGTLIEKGATVLFQGDSITDAGRNRADGFDLGQGYAMMAASWFTALHPERRVQFLNRGVGGDRVKDLRARWERDCLELKPMWLSILIGINDTWRRYDSNDCTSAEEFEAVYRDILSQARDRLGARLILCEPFVLHATEDKMQWRADLDPKIHAVRKLAREFGAIFVPLDGLFAAASTRREPGFWAADGVHPSPAGHALMAQAWLRSVSEG